MSANQRHPLQRREFGLSPDGARFTIAWREAGRRGAPALVLLHGIGSGAGSWLDVLDDFAGTHRVIAWDAPGYGGSSPLTRPAPFAADYAERLEALIEGLELGPVSLVGHSLGALMAAATAGRGRVAVDALVLASPAPGYGAAPAEVRQRKTGERLAMLERVGIEGIARERSAALAAPGASESVIAVLQANMRLATPGGYRQATAMLDQDDLRGHLRQAKRRFAVICGALDTITPPKGAKALADEFGASGATYREIDGLAHALYVEDAARFGAALRDALVEQGPA